MACVDKIPDQSRLISDLIKDSKLIIFDGANHAVHRDRNKEVLQAIREFIE